MSNSIGNLKNSGLKGNNWPWQYKMLQGLQGIIDVISSTANGSEYEAKVVNIDCPGDPGDPFTGERVYLEVRTWNTVTGGFTDIAYYEPGDINNPLLPADVANCTITYAESEVPYTLGQKIMAESVPVTLASDQLGIARTPGMLRATGAGPLDLVTVVGSNLYSVSVANVGATDATVLGSTIKPNESLNFNADAVNNFFTTFTYDPLTSELLFIYVI